MAVRPSLRATVVDFQDIWARVERNVNQILENPMKRTEEPLTRLHTCVYRLVSNAATNLPVAAGDRPVKETIEWQSLLLRQNLEELLRQHLGERVRPAIVGYDLEMIKSYLRQWEHFCCAIRLITAIFNYAHAQWKKSVHQGQAQHGTDTSGIASQLWVRMIVQPLRDPLMHSLLRQVADERSGVPIDRGTMRVMLHSLANLSHALNIDRRPQVYQDVFEGPFLEATQAHFNADAEQFLAENDVRRYLDHARDVLHDEGQRMQYLHNTTYAPLRKVLITTLVESRLQVLVQDADKWMDRNDTEALEKLFFILQQSETCLEPLRRLLEDRIATDGQEEVAKVSPDVSKDPSLFIGVLIGLLEKYTTMVRTTFSNNKHLQLALQSGMKKAVNYNAVTQISPGKHQTARTAECLAKYCNLLLRPQTSQSREIRDLTHFEEIAKHILSTFKLLDDRDVFQSVYANLMCSRLIYNNLVDERETLMLQKFKEQCGHEFTYKWQRMYSDCSNAYADDFKQWCEGKGYAQPLQINPMVLTSGSWPTAVLSKDDRPPMIVPSLSRLLSQFEEYYKGVSQGKRLTWMHHFSHGTVKTNLTLAKPKAYDLTVSQLQLTLLSLFNTPDAEPAVTFNEYVAAASCDASICSRQLMPFIKVKLLLATPEGAQESQQTLRLNPEFFNNNRKMTLLPTMQATPAKQESAADEPDTHAQVVGERKFAIQAAIVRLMKSRRTMVYKDILQETFNVLKSRFAPQVPQIKENIEVLIEKDYIERSSEDPNVFNYLA